MATANRINLSPDRYVWAIQRAGLTVDGYMDSHPKVTLACWMDGTKAPTIKQLEDFAKSVHIPFDFLFLDSVPVGRIPFPVFRGEASQSQISVLSVQSASLVELTREG